eukprot:TRINITY_DN2955_c0_g4_i3.p1 TRINITY_DN2955_c0_g4~~TRINITY_DN2955_c0_g4_i3.p1  ORF type:complete len:2510 (+),score=474.52 TRINITY_DN2955_c0_g4_i3:87-7616(+)
MVVCFQGGTIVTVSGRGFTSKSSYVCHFGSFPAVTHFISSTEIQCEAPQLLHGMGRMFIVSVSNNGVNFTDNTDVWFSYDLPLHVSTISPSKGSILGGTEVLLLGSNFHFYAGAYSRSEILCKFGTSGVEVSAMLLDDETLSCVSPSSESTESSTVDLFVALNGVDFLPIGHEFHFYSNFKLIRLSPNRGSPLLSNRFDSNAEGTPILVHGSGFVESEDLLCKVGQQISKARFITSAVVECVVAVVHLSEQEQSRDLFVAISNNGIDFADALVFTVDLPPMVFSITPNSGLFRGQIPSFVTGDNFQNSTDLACRFGQQDVPALYLSSQQVVCVVPSRVGNQIEPFGSIDVEITNNGIDYSASGVEFEYISECPEGHYCSRWEIFAAPNGTYAEGSGNVNFTMCEPGAFQPKTQQTSCLRCPIGFYCPDFGMAAPRICKAGFVCDILGLRTPVTPCPPGHYCLEGTKTSNPGDLKASGEWVEDPDTLMLTFVPSSRTWAFVDRVLPETGQSRAEHPPSTENLPLKGERPFPCPIGYYCLPGVATPNPQVKNFSTPQKCFNGFYCPIGSTTPEGDGPCTTGHYCPDDVTSIPCPIGHFCPKVGNIRALECRPGTYNPLTMQSKCVLCPPGHICPGWGRTEPDICPAGFVCMEPGLSAPVFECPAGYFCEKGTLSQDPTLADFVLEKSRSRVLSSLVSGAASPTYSTFSSARLIPQPCAGGTFCLGGVAQDTTIEWLPLQPDGKYSPQPCTEGTYCMEATPGPQGTGRCLPGHYCPPGSDWPTQAPIGNFASKEGSVVPMLCFPGTYAPLKATVECFECPAGHTCTSYGTYMPEICASGTYRSLADSITCRSCPEGTFTAIMGATDISLCEPCPQGRVCGSQQMTGLQQSSPCPDGYMCGVVTPKEKQFVHPTPGGYYSYEETKPLEQFDNVCKKGYYCGKGTKGYMSTRSKCAVGYYCPPGCPRALPTEHKCPTGTTSVAGSSQLTDCQVAEVNVCDKKEGNLYLDDFWYYYNDKKYTFNSGEEEIEVLRRINPVYAGISSDYWVNDKVETFRSCPPFGTKNGLEAIVVIGRKLVPQSADQTNLLRCRFGTPLADNPKRGYIDEVAEAITSENEEKYTRVTCKTPPLLLLQGRGYVGGADVPLSLSSDSVHFSDSVSTFTYYDFSDDSASAPAYSDATCLAKQGTEESVWEDEQNWFPLQALNVAEIAFSFEHLPTDFKYNQHYRIAIFVRKSSCAESACNAKREIITDEDELEVSPCLKPLHLSPWFLDDSVDKHQKININLYSLQDVIFKVEIHILYGIYLSVSPQFMRSAAVNIIGPSRALVTFGNKDPPKRKLGTHISFNEREIVEQYTFVSVYKNEYISDISAPLNMPPRFSSYERGRVLPIFSVDNDDTETKWVLDNIDDTRIYASYWENPRGEISALIEKYDETFVECSGEGSDMACDTKQLVLSYVPFLSSCKGFDSYMPWFQLLESNQCGLADDVSTSRSKFPAIPHQDDIFVVSPFDIMKSPIADECHRSINCEYEEELAQKDITLRWFEASDGSELFQIPRFPMTWSEYQEGGARVDEILATQGLDTFIGVAVDRTAAMEVQGDCSYLCFPRSVNLEITYHQVNTREKKIVTATVAFDNFDRDSSNPSYELSVDFYALNWLELIINFAFEREVFIMLFIAIGFITVGVTLVFWTLNRLLTRLKNPPKFRFFTFMAIIAPAPIVGVGLATVACSFVLVAIFLLIRGDEYLGTPGQKWFLDSIYGHYMDQELDESKIPTIRKGRIGLAFLIFALYLVFLGTKTFLPRRVSKREREIELKRDEAAQKESIWIPTMWKRSNMAFTSVILALCLIFVVEFSFWSDFGTYIWFVIVALRFIGIGVELILEIQLKETLLLCPLMSTVLLIQQLITFGADDFTDFLLSYFVEFALMVFERVFFDPGAKRTMEWSRVKMTLGFIWLRNKFNLNIGSSLVAEMEQEKRNEEIMRRREVDFEVAAKEANTVEPILDAFAVYCNETMALFYQPFLIMVLWIFRDEIVLPDQYGIKQQDMEYYLWFSVVILFFQLCADMFLHNVQELFHGWKIYDYLVYTRYRFSQREMRWKGLEDSLDECIEEGMRTLDQMCFSSQFYLMSALHTTGLMFIILAAEIMIRSDYNMFGDPAMLIIVPFVVIVCKIVRWTCIKFEKRVGIWELKHAKTDWLGDQAQNAEDGLPTWAELEKMKGASHQDYLMNQRITSETFRHKFLDYNRPWLVAQLPAILTPRTLKRSRPYLLAQMAKILNSVNPDISSDSGEDSDFDFGPVNLTNTSRTMIRIWLANARRNVKLRSIVQPDITKARMAECERCLSRKMLHVEMVVPLKELADQFEATQPESDEVDEVAWREFFRRHQRYRTLCLKCIARRKEQELKSRSGGEMLEDGDQEFGPVFLNSAARAMMLRWFDEAATNVRQMKFGPGGRARPERLDISSDSEEDDIGPAWAQKPLKLSATQKALAQRWLVLARTSLSKHSGAKSLGKILRRIPKKKK